MLRHGIVAFLGFGRRDVADGLEQPAIVEPVHPLQRRELDSLERPPWPTPVDDLGLVETIDGFGESIVIAVPDAAYRRFDSGFGEPLGVFDRNILGAAIA